MKKKLLTCQRHYLETFRAKPVQELVEDTGLEEKVVLAFLEKLPRGDHFGRRPGAVVMTQAQAEQDDEAQKKKAAGPGRNQDHIFRPYPDRPSY